MQPLVVCLLLLAFSRFCHRLTSAQTHTKLNPDEKPTQSNQSDHLILISSSRPLLSQNDTRIFQSYLITFFDTSIIKPFEADNEFGIYCLISNRRSISMQWLLELNVKKRSKNINLFWRTFCEDVKQIE